MTDHVQYEELCSRVGSGCSENLEMIFKPNTKWWGGGEELWRRWLAVVVLSCKCHSSVWVGFGVRENKRLDQRLHTGARRLEPASEQVVRLVKEI